MQPVMKLSSLTTEQATFQAMADATLKQMKSTGNALAKKVRAASPVGLRGKRRSKMSKLYGSLKSGKTKFTTRGKRTRVFNSDNGKYKWKYQVERAVLLTPFYGYFLDKGWTARGGKNLHRYSKEKSVRNALSTRHEIPGNHYVTDTIKNYVG